MARCFTEVGKPAGHMVVTGALMPFLTSPILMTLVIFLSVLCLAAVLTHLAQTGPMFVTERFSPDLSKLNPIKGIKNYFNLRRLVTSGQSVVKLVIILAFSYAAVKEAWESPVFSRPVNASELGAFFQHAAWAVGWRVLLALLLIAVVDYLYQKWQYEKDNKMSHQEAKDEHKQTEGSPEVKGAQRRKMFQMRRSLRRQLEDMADSTIVITNPTHYAVALRYIRNETPTPVVVAKGIRLNALQIKERAAELGVPTMENVPLARGLFKHGQVGEPIPALYYQAVAQVLADLFRRGYRMVRE
jgi:flagellar biosynthetic protein FlhB